jgi:hypothetical protein
MGLNASKVEAPNSKGKIVLEPLDPGVYPGRLVQVVDLGVQPQKPYKGEDKPPIQEVMLTYEFVDEFIKDEEGNDIENKPRWYSETIPFYSLNADRAKSTQRIHALDPEGVHNGDLALMVGSPCNITLVHNNSGDKLYVNIAGIATMRERDVKKCPELKNPPKVFDLSNPDLEIFGSLPEWIQDKIKKNLKYQGSPLQKLFGEAPRVDKEEDPEDSDEDNPY